VSARPHTVSPYRVALEGAQEALLAALSRTPSAAESSVSMSRNAKGVAQFEVTVRGPDPADCHSEAERIYDALCAAYPYPTTNGSAEA